MPRASKTSTRKHAAAVPIQKRSFAAPEAIEKILPGSAPDITIEAIPPKATPAIGFDKVFYGAITAGASSKPYSRSHLKREKKKARQQVGGGLGSVAAALEEATEPAERLRVLKKGKAVPVVEVAPQKRKVEPDGRMGEGSARTPGEKQRRKQIATNAKRIPAVMSHPAFKANPWATIREHANNTLAAADGVKSVQDRKAEEERKVRERERIALGGMIVE